MPYTKRSFSQAPRTPASPQRPRQFGAYGGAPSPEPMALNPAQPPQAGAGQLPPQQQMPPQQPPPNPYTQHQDDGQVVQPQGVQATVMQDVTGPPQMNDAARSHVDAIRDGRGPPQMNDAARSYIDAIRDERAGGGGGDVGGGETGDFQTELEKRITEMLGGPRDTEEEKALLREIMEEQYNQQLGNQRARMGRLGMGASGAMGAVEGDMRRRMGQSIAKGGFDLDAGARGEELDRVRVAGGLGLQGMTENRLQGAQDWHEGRTDSNDKLWNAFLESQIPGSGDGSDPGDPADDGGIDLGRYDHDKGIWDYNVSGDSLHDIEDGFNEVMIDPWVGNEQAARNRAERERRYKKK